MQVQVAPMLGHAYELEPERPAGSRAATDQAEEEHHEKKPVLKKVKEKVKKIKNTIKKKHGHGNDYDHHQDRDTDDQDDEDDDDDEEDDESLNDPEIHGGNLIIAPEQRATGEYSASSLRTSGVDTSPLKDLDQIGGFKEDSAAPNSNPSKTEKYRGGEEIETSPVIESFEAMTVSDQPPAKHEASEGRKLMEEEKGRGSSYTEKISTTAKNAYGKVADAGAEVVAKVVQPTTSATKTACGKVADAGTGVVEKLVQPGSIDAEGGRRVSSAKLAEKLKPGEEDKALSEVISDAIRKGKTTAEEKVAGRGGGVGMIGRLKGAATTWVGGRVRSWNASWPLSEQERKEMGELKGRDMPKEEILKQIKDLK
ncbi:hypothetical protein Cni_G15921 [Canna indica]|uniref:Uncharacterized protein n=1 Tax=Canna indica TaxID=4628 RepID=A0AAQ3QFF4_9LILI|nr:hypothetical protein Cni_G15921 [Canna indica]